MNYHIIYSVPGTGGLTYARKELLKKLKFVNERNTSVLNRPWGRYINWGPKIKYDVGKFVENLNQEISGGSYTDTIIYGPGVSKHPTFTNNLSFIDSITRYYIVPRDFGDVENSVLANRSANSFLESRSNVYNNTENKDTFAEKYKSHIRKFYENVGELNLTFTDFESFNYEGGNIVISNTGRSLRASEGLDDLKMAII